MAAFSFVLPSVVPQDLLLIHDIVGDVSEPAAPPNTATLPVHDDEHGTDSDTDSEKEVEDNILAGQDDDEGHENPTAPELTGEDDSSSDSSSDSEDDDVGRSKDTAKDDADLDDDDETGPAVTSGAQVRTKNELVEFNILIPQISEVGPDEVLEKVGEVSSIVDGKVAIVKGISSSISNRGSEKALDADTLLVFEDRAVLGYVSETFGPTSEPLYQVLFNSSYPLDAEKVKVARPVYHVPERSNYVFVRQIKHIKGSDASNVHDEEPGEDELEFSDDEQEAAHKRALADKRGRSRSVASSRHATPVPSTQRDQDMIEDAYGSRSQDVRLSYDDMDPSAGPSRSPPIPYDDPYSDSYGVPPPAISREEISSQSNEPPSPQPQSPTYGKRPERGRGRGRLAPRGGFVKREERGEGGRGRGRGRKPYDRGRGWTRGGGPGGDRRASAGRGTAHAEYDPRIPRPLSPTSLAIARATGQYSDGTAVASDMQSGPSPSPEYGGGAWAYPQGTPQMFDFNFPYVQPHINPRFASQFGLTPMGASPRFGYTDQSAAYGHPGGYTPHSDQSFGGWGGDWGPGPQPPAGGQ